MQGLCHAFAAFVATNFDILHASDNLHGRAEAKHLQQRASADFGAVSGQTSLEVEVMLRQQSLKPRVQLLLIVEVVILETQCRVLSMQHHTLRIAVGQLRSSARRARPRLMQNMQGVAAVLHTSEGMEPTKHEAEQRRRGVGWPPVPSTANAV